jgi:hypothetical protein
MYANTCGNSISQIEMPKKTELADGFVFARTWQTSFGLSKSRKINKGVIF